MKNLLAKSLLSSQILTAAFLPAILPMIDKSKMIEISNRTSFIQNVFCPFLISNITTSVIAVRILPAIEIENTIERIEEIKEIHFHPQIFEISSRA